MNIPFKSLINLIKSSTVTPSQEWQDKTLQKIRAIEGYQTKKSANFNIFNSFNPFYMKKLLSGVLAVMVVVVIGGYFYSQNTPYAKAMQHLNNAEAALDQLKNPSTPPQVGLIPTAYAEVSEETTIVELIQTVESETDQAVEESEGITDPEDTAEVLGEVDDLQTETVEVLTPLIANSESAEVVTTATVTVENTDASNEVVEETRNAAEVSAAKREKKIAVRMREKIKERREIRRTERTEKIEDIIASLQASYDNMDEPMKKKYDTIKEVLANCESDEDESKCNLGRAKGLATALNAKARNEARQEERKEHLEELKALQEQNKEEMEAQREETKQLMEENKEEMEGEREELKELLEDGDREAIEDQKEDIKQLKEQQKEELEKQKEETKELMEKNKEEQKDLLEKLKEEKKLKDPEDDEDTEEDADIDEPEDEDETEVEVEAEVEVEDEAEDEDETEVEVEAEVEVEDEVEDEDETEDEVEDEQEDETEDEDEVETPSTES